MAKPRLPRQTPLRAVPKPGEYEPPPPPASGPTMEAVRITAALDEIALISLELRELMSRIWLLQYAHIGLLHTAASLKVPPGEFTEYCDLAEVFESLHGETRNVFDRCVDVAHTLGGKKGGQS